MGARMATEAMVHRFELRVYYEDTDLAGIVYYANYLKFIERARSEWVRACGVNQAQLKAETGVVFAVRKIEADYLQAAHFEDLLQVETQLVDLTGARIMLVQRVKRDQTLLFESRVVLVCIGPKGAMRLPSELRAALAQPLPKGD